MSHRRDNPPAFPRAMAIHEAGDDPQMGMSLRDHFAGLAMQALMAKSPFEMLLPGEVGEKAAKRAQSAYMMADAMLTERAKP